MKLATYHMYFIFADFIINLKMTVLLLLMLTILNVATCTVYNITPADTIKHRYMFKAAGYFTSNTQLHFLPGLHHLLTSITIQNINNISLIGSLAYGTAPETIIQCISSVGIVIFNITNLLIENLIFKNCKIQQQGLQVAIIIEKCSLVQLHFVHVYHARQVISLLGINIFGDSYLQDITCFEMRFYYSETVTKTKNHTILVNRYNITNSFAGKYGIYLDMSQYSYKITFHVLNTFILKLKRAAFLYVTANNSGVSNTVFISNSIFANNSYLGVNFFLYSVNVSVHLNYCQFFYNKYLNCKGFISISHGENIGIFHCSFNYNTLLKGRGLIRAINVSNSEIKHCNFHGNNVNILEIFNSTILIHNTTFSLIKIPVGFISIYACIYLRNSRLLFKGPVEFHKNIIYYRSIILISNSNITFNGYIEFSRNYACSIIHYQNDNSSYQGIIVKVEDNTTIIIISNKIFRYFNIDKSIAIKNFLDAKYTHPQCFIQYFSAKSLDRNVPFGKFLITIKNNTFTNLSIRQNSLNFMAKFFAKEDLGFEYEKRFMDFMLIEIPIKITHCYWLPHSAFNITIPLDVNRQYIQYKNNSKSLQFGSIEKTICYCNDEKIINCFKDELNPLYPGQTLKVSFCVHNSTETIAIIAVDIKQMCTTSCTVMNANEQIQFTSKNCTEVKYTISFPTNNWCELFLKTPQTIYTYDIFYVRELPCPLGFVKIDGICQCYSSFKQFGFTDCDINTQMILRPSKGWISLDIYTQHNNSFSCYISQHCPFDHCKPYSFYVNLSTPDSQCQFNRTGLLCGQCQQGLSAIFSSSHCQHCSNIYLLLIIPIAVAGLVLVLILFLLNLTVSDGAINPFILYVNIISINSTTYFPDHHAIADPMHIFISFTNLDLGIKTCFYNGMDDYAKVWLQLAFPFYMISITLLTIMASRYSITIQRVTIHKSIPVLATLFLLSFTKILRTTSNVLFFYSSITHLPSEHATLLWSLDVNIPLLGIKFTFLFAVCLLLFIILLLFTGFTLCPKRIFKLKFFNNLKSLSDCYQRPYKIYYWFGLQIVMRIIFFCASFLDVKYNFIIIFIILNIANGFQGMRRPFKNKLHHYQELFLMMNLLVLYVFLLHEQWFVIYALIYLTGVHFSLIIGCRIMSHVCSRLKMKIPLCCRLANRIYQLRTILYLK